jgi:tetratricopeptide (TPR) repeat protein
MRAALGQHRAGQLAQAQVLYRQVLGQDPNHDGALHFLGVLALQDNRLDLAIEYLRRALLIQPNVPEYYGNLGNALMAQGLWEEAAACYRQLLNRRPQFAEAHSTLGNALMALGKDDEALACYHRAIELKPDYAAAHNNLGNALRNRGRLEEAAASYRRALELNPDDAETHSNSSTLRLLRGNYAHGFVEFEWRLQTPKHLSRPRVFKQPYWDGGPLDGRTILLTDEQGHGDTIQFVRYAALVAQRGGNVVVECQPPLKRLLQNSLGAIRVIDDSEAPPPFDVHCSLLSLPMIFRTTLETIPNRVPYIRPDAESVARWRSKIEGEAGFRKVGLAWAGNRNQMNDHNRSMALHHLAPLGKVSGVRFYNLQIGEAARQASLPGAALQFMDRTNEITDFADTAALIANLDLVISVDTSISHLAGAMAKPVWTMLCFAADWRYHLDRDDCPWYPTMRLFRQPAPGAWASVVERVAEALRDMPNV